MPKKTTRRMEANISLKTGTTAATLLSIVPNLHSKDILKLLLRSSRFIGIYVLAVL